MNSTIQNTAAAPAVNNAQPIQDDTLPAYTASPNGAATNKDFIATPPLTETPQHQTPTANPAASKVEDSTAVRPLKALDESPEWIDCPYCNTRAKTRVEKEPTTST